MTWARLTLLFTLSVVIGVLIAIERSPPAPREARARTWLESRDVHIEQNIPSITRNVALRILSEHFGESTTTGAATDSMENVLRKMLPEWMVFHEDAWRQFAPRKELLKGLLQRELGSMRLVEIALVQQRCGAGGVDPYPVSVVVEGRRVILLIDLQDWAELFPVGEGGIAPERQLEARIRRDLREGRHVLAVGERMGP